MLKKKTDSIELKSIRDSISKELEYKWNPKILVVDEDPMILEFYGDILTSATSEYPQREGTGKWSQFRFEVEEASSPDEALKKITNVQEDGESYAVVFLEINFDGSDEEGVDLANRIFRQLPEAHLVFVTSSKDMTVEDIGEALGEEWMDQWDFISKPFLRGEILQKARNYISVWNHKKEKQIQHNRLNKLQEQLNETERTTSLAAVARGTNHEFSNILMQIIGKAELSLRKKDYDLKPAMEQILEACFRARDILERFRNVTDVRKLSQALEPTNLTDVICWTMDLMERQLQEANVQIYIIGDEEIPIMGNSTALMQVILNLMINALDSMPSGGDLMVELLTIDEKATLKVRDQGPGIDDEILEKVFEPLFTTKGERGTGLGLSICKEIIEREHDGELSLRNHPDGGLEIEIILPVLDSKKQKRFGWVA